MKYQGYESIKMNSRDNSKDKLADWSKSQYIILPPNHNTIKKTHQIFVGLDSPMFSSRSSSPSHNPLRTKQQSFKKQCTHSSKQNTLQSLRYMTFSELIDWHTPFSAFQSKASTHYNYYTILNTLFAISEQMDWRLYIGHMNLLIATFHNIMCGKKGAGLQDVGKILDFETKLERLFLLKDLDLHKHLMLLVKMLLAYNPKYGFLKESAFSLILIESATYNNPATVTEILWILSQIEVSSEAFIKLIKHQGLNQALNKDSICLLPLLTIVANFLSDPNQDHHIVEQLITSHMFQRIFQMGLNSGRHEIVNETILMFNNGVCFSHLIGSILLKDPHTITIIMSFDCPQKEKFGQILGILQCQNQANFVKHNNMSSENYLGLNNTM